MKMNNQNSNSHLTAIERTSFISSRIFFKSKDKRKVLDFGCRWKDVELLKLKV
jgi:hypothetical protein